MVLGQTTLVRFRELVADARSQGKNLVPVVRTIFADTITPVQAYRSLNGHQSTSALLESVKQGDQLGRYSVIAVNPFARFASYGQRSGMYYFDANRAHETKTEPLAHLSALLDENTPLSVPEIDCFTGGALGYIGYEAVLLLETTVPPHANDDLHCPDILLHFYRQVVVFDHVSQQLHLVTNMHLNGDDETLYRRALKELDQLEANLAVPLPDFEPIVLAEAVVSSNLTKEEYLSMVGCAKEYIAAGDIFQVVLSQRFQRPFMGSSLHFYRLLRMTNPSPYMFHINFGGGMTLVGASPEVMVRVHGSSMLVRPIAGTRRRGRNDEEDATLAAELAADPKERAEHLMLVDLARNDVGRFCEYGSVAVQGMNRVERYSHVMHMVSDVVGRLRAEVNPMQAIVGCLPAGTLSGAPKVRAMQIITELEGAGRGPYGGAVGWFRNDGSDSAICIRTAFIKDGIIYWQSGGGIVADSEPEAEYEESLAKSRAIRRVLDLMVKGGVHD